MKPEIDLWALEDELYDSGISTLCGVDEAGRGPLAGPVCAAAVILPRGLVIAGLDDSKKLSEKRREALYDEITQKALHWHAAFASGAGAGWASWAAAAAWGRATHAPPGHASCWANTTAAKTAAANATAFFMVECSFLCLLGQRHGRDPPPRPPAEITIPRPTPPRADRRRHANPGHHQAHPKRTPQTPKRRHPPNRTPIQHRRHLRHARERQRIPDLPTPPLVPHDPRRPKLRQMLTHRRHPPIHTLRQVRHAASPLRQPLHDPQTGRMPQGLEDLYAAHQINHVAHLAGRSRNVPQFCEALSAAFCLDCFG